MKRPKKQETKKSVGKGALQVPGLVTPDYLTTPPQPGTKKTRAAAKAPRETSSASANKSGGNQLPQGVNAYRAAVMELMLQKQHRLTLETAEAMLKILIDV